MGSLLPRSYGDCAIVRESRRPHAPEQGSAIPKPERNHQEREKREGEGEVWEGVCLHLRFFLPWTF